MLTLFSTCFGHHYAHQVTAFGPDTQSILPALSSQPAATREPDGLCDRARSKRDGTRAETRFGLLAKRTSPFKLARRGEGSVLSTTGSRGVRISGSNGSNAGYTTFWGRVQDYWLPTPLARFPFTSPTVRHRVPSGFS